MPMTRQDYQSRQKQTLVWVAGYLRKRCAWGFVIEQKNREQLYIPTDGVVLKRHARNWCGVYVDLDKLAHMKGNKGKKPQYYTKDEIDALQENFKGEQLCQTIGTQI